MKKSMPVVILCGGMGTRLGEMTEVRPQPLVEIGGRSALARIMHETSSRDRGIGRATGQPQGLGPETYLIRTLQGSRPEDTRKDGHCHGRSRCFGHYAG